MSCDCENICGGCPLRNLGEEDYRRHKQAFFAQVLSRIKQADIKTGTPIFIADGTRRRASLAFRRTKGEIVLGFNVAQSREICPIENCALLTPALNAVLPRIRALLQELCRQPQVIKKGKKQLTRYIEGGDVWLCQAEGGIDVVLEYDEPLDLNARMVIFEMAQSWADVIRISHRRNPSDRCEPLIEKSKPFVNIGGYHVYIPAGTFLQPSFEGEQALTSLVMHYLGDTKGAIADLFCGVGTFSYHLCRDTARKITAVDSSAELLNGFQDSVNKNMISNVTVKCRNLFKYPLDAGELSGFAAVVFDPPRAGAAAQAAQLAAAAQTSTFPHKVIAVSCNPNTFVNDADTLISAGYHLDEVTFVDQFVYSNHSEIVALFTKG